MKDDLKRNYCHITTLLLTTGLAHEQIAEILDIRPFYIRSITSEKTQEYYINLLMEKETELLAIVKREAKYDLGLLVKWMDRFVSNKQLDYKKQYSDEDIMHIVMIIKIIRKCFKIKHEQIASNLIKKTDYIKNALNNKKNPSHSKYFWKTRTQVFNFLQTFRDHRDCISTEIILLTETL